MGRFLVTSFFLLSCLPCEASLREILKDQYRQIALKTAREYKIDPALLFAVISKESDWQARVRSEKGALGLMQLMPETARNWGVRNSLDPQQNIRGGVRYLKHLLSLFDRNIPLALAAYHAGEGRIIRTFQIPDIPETQWYVRDVLTAYWKIKNPPKRYQAVRTISLFKGN